MSFFESLRIALNAIRVNKMRSILTMLGIIIGIASVIAIFALGNGGEAAINDEFKSFGVNRMILYHNPEEEVASRDLVTLEDLDAIQRAFSDDIVAVSPSSSAAMSVVQKTHIQKDEGISVTVNGVSHTYDQIEDIPIVSGRFLLESDSDGLRNVVIIDEDLAMDVFGKTDVVGERLTLSYYSQRITFTIVGVEEASKDSLLSGFNPAINVYVPYVTLAQITGAGNYIYMTEINTTADANKEALEGSIVSLIAQRHRTSEDNYKIFTAESEMDAVNTVMGYITGIISAVAAISLVVGGIGVMNIMLVSVTERTREIGIRKALGAQRRDILLQFLVEAVIISLIGGVIGTVIGATIALVAASQLGLPTLVPMDAVLIAWLFSAGVGIFFGLYPANKAAKLDPIDALRYE